MPIAEGGPWDIEFRPEIRAHTFLINRETGEVFQLFEDKDVNPYWYRMKVLVPKD